MLEFKLQCYYELYKNTCIISATKFKNEFIKNNGEFPLLNELIIMIQKYQIKKYGKLIEADISTYTEMRKGDQNKREQKRIYSRFGNKVDRNRRKIESKRR